jgi:hypothetical protein
MAPIKFEEQLKDKLEKRSLPPSSDTWAKLSNRLDTEEQKSKNLWFWWMGLAAGLLIMLAIAVQTFSSKDSQEVMPQMVEEDKIEINTLPKQPDLNNTQITDLAVEDEKKKKEKLEQLEITDYKSITNKEPKANTQLANNSTKEDLKIEVLKVLDETQLLVKEETEINTNVVTEVLKELKVENIAVTDREVDSLLKLASKELFKDKLKKEVSRTVDANRLLEDVQDEMGQSFRSKVFDALKDSYKTIKTKVVERNN